MALGRLYDPRQKREINDDTTDEAATALGIQVLDPDEDDDAPEPPQDKCYLWPCNVRMYDLWCELQTQWQCSMRGREGLNYDSVIRYLREVAHIRPRRLPEVMECIRAMERAALEAWDEQRQEQQSRDQSR